MRKHNKRRVLAMLLCSILILFCGCSTASEKYKRISFESDTLGEALTCITENTSVEYNADETFASSISIYQIKERNISKKELRKLMEAFEFPDDPYELEHKGNSINIALLSYTDSSRGYVEMSETELEALAWEMFNKIPFMEGEYEYGGIKGWLTVEGHGEKHFERVKVSFYPVLDGVRVIGDNKCEMWFDGGGLVEIQINLYDFKKIGTMDVVSLEDAKTQIMEPDDFSIDDTNRTVDKLQVDSVKMYLVNQHSRDCEILQPMYTFCGTAKLNDKSDSEFKSKVIAIPESMTYEE